MIDPSIIKLLEDCAKSKANYLLYLDNLDNIYDIEFITTLYNIMRLQKDSLDMAMTLLSQRYDHLKTLTFTTKIYIEKYSGYADGSIIYYVFPQVTPNIPDGDKMIFVRPGAWFENDEVAAIAFAEALKVTYGGEIVKTIV